MKVESSQPTSPADPRTCISKDQHILCVDDESIILHSLREELRKRVNLPGVKIDIADNGDLALEMIDGFIAEGEDVPVIISDQRMPGMTGDEFLARAHVLSPESRNIMLTGYTDLEAITRLVNQDALYRYIAKPWDSRDLIMTVQEAYRSWYQAMLIRELSMQNEKLSSAMVAALESANLYYDEETGQHILRLAKCSTLIAQAYGLDEGFVRRIRLYASLHDIGKIGVSRDILSKPVKLTTEEFETMKQHVAIGYRILENDDIDKMARNVTLYHHEKWDGSGYLSGLRGQDIPLEARIVCLADVFDALVSTRVYKPSVPFDDAVSLIGDGSGTLFDPELVHTFMDSIPEIRELYANASATLMPSTAADMMPPA
jgi:putative two-component system response regulator